MMWIRRLTAAVAAGLFWVSAQAGVKVLGVELGVTTVEEVRQLASQAGPVQDAGFSPWVHGPVLVVEQGDYGIEGLESVSYIFDGEDKMVGLLMRMSKDRFADIYGILVAKYTLTEEQLPFVGHQYARFSAPGARIELDAPHLSFEMTVSYLTSEFVDAIQAGRRAQEAQKRAQEESQL